MIEKFNKNAKVEKFTNFLGIAIRLIVIDPYPALRLCSTCLRFCQNARKQAKLKKMR